MPVALMVSLGLIALLMAQTVLMGFNAAAALKLRLLGIWMLRIVVQAMVIIGVLHRRNGYRIMGIALASLEIFPLTVLLWVHLALDHPAILAVRTFALVFLSIQLAMELVIIGGLAFSGRYFEK